MLMSIIYAVAVFATVIAASWSLSHSREGKLVDGEIFLSVNETGKRAMPEWLMALCVAATAGVVNYFATRAAMPFVVIFLLVMVGLYALTVAWWEREGSEVSELVIFMLLIALLFFPMMACSFALASFFESAFVSTVVIMIPFWVLIVALGRIICNFYYFRKEVNEENGAEEKVVKRWRLLGRIAFGFFLVLLVASVVMAATGCFAWASALASQSVAQEQTEEPAGPTAEELEAIENLTVEKVTPAELEQLTVNKYSGISWLLLDSSLSPNDKARTEKTGFSDALTFGFGAKEDDTMFAELQEEILCNPVYGVTVVNAIKDKTIGGSTIGSFNPWMGEMIALNDQYGVSYWLEKDAEGDFYVTEEYRCYAATLCTWLERLIPQGIQARPTVENWCLNPAAANNDRKGAVADYQYTKDAFILAYVGKNEGAGTGSVAGSGASQTDGLFVIGFNIHDKRPEFYGIEPEPTPTPAPTPTPEPTPTPTPTPEPTPTPTPTPTPDPPYNKDPNLAPKENTEPNDDKGPGTSTNNGPGATTSTADQPTNSDHGTYTEYRESIDELNNTNQTQKTGSDPSTPSTPSGGAAVDNNGDAGTSTSAPINTPTPVTPPATDANTGETISTNPGEAWGGPTD